MYTGVRSKIGYFIYYSMHVRSCAMGINQIYLTIRVCARICICGVERQRMKENENEYKRLKKRNTTIHSVVVIE